jgi:hypothetical protein
VGDAIELDPKGCAEIAVEALYREVNRRSVPGTQLDPRLKPLLLEEVETGVERALVRFYEED